MQKNARRDILLLFITILWILTVLGGYYYYHKPIDIQMVAAPLSPLLDVVFVALFAGLAGGLGRRLLPIVQTQDREAQLPTLERSTLQFALGAGAISLVWLVLGILGLYRFPLAAPLLAGGIFLVRSDALAWYRGLGALWDCWRSAGRLEKLLALFSGVLIAYQFFIALAPPLKWDALAYHLQLPRQYLDAGRFFFTPENPYWGHPQLVEMLNTFAMSFHRAETAALLGWSTGVMFLLGLLGCTNTLLARLTGEQHSSNAGWVAVTAVVAGATFRYMLAWSYTDLFSALFGLAALIAFYEWLEQRRPAWFLWAAVFSGLAIGTKWTSGIVALAIFIAALALRRQSKLSARLWFAGGAAAFLVVAPWLLKNLLVTGSPLYPYIIATPWYDAARLASADEAAAIAIEWWQHILLPFSSTWIGIEGAVGFSADLGPLLLLFAAPGFIRFRRTPQAQVMGILLGITAFGLGVASLKYTHLMQTRLYFAALAAAAIPCGWGWDWLQKQVIQGVRLRRIFSAVILLVLGLTFWQDSYSTAMLSPLHILVGTQTRQAYLENALGSTQAAMQKLAALPASAQTLMLWEPRGFYAPLNTQADLWIDRWRTDRRELGTAPAILQRWKEKGYTHLLVYQRGVELIRPLPGQEPTQNWIVFQDMLNLLPAPEQIGDGYRLYTLE